jgi:hypothetical protein
MTSKKWIKALRFGEYVQGYGSLKSDYDGKIVIVV